VQQTRDENTEDEEEEAEKKNRWQPTSFNCF